MAITYETREVTVSLDEIMRLDFEGGLDLMEELFNAADDEEHRGILSDIAYEVVGHTDDGGIVVRISAEVERDEDEEDA